MAQHLHSSLIACFPSRLRPTDIKAGPCTTGQKGITDWILILLIINIYYYLMNMNVINKIVININIINIHTIDIDIINPIE